MDRLTESLTAFLKRYSRSQRVWVAYSGGLDSRVLLQLLAQVSTALSITPHVIHVHHGCHPDADAWAKQCEATAAALKLPFLCERLPLNALPTSDPENILRELRNGVFRRHMAEDDLLLTGHHQQDQAETVLLQMLRGAGPKGLAAMPAISTFGRGFHGRPLLDFSRETLQAFAVQAGLQWINDPSNTDPRFVRNYLRQEVMPQILTRFPELNTILSRVAKNCADLQNCLEAYVQADRQRAVGSMPQTLSVNALQSLSEYRQAAVVREWISTLGFRLPSRKKLLQLLQDVLFCRADRSPCVAWQGAVVRRYRDDLYLMQPLPLHDATQCIAWDGCEPLVIKNIGVLSAAVPALGGVYSVRFRSGGEVCRLPKRGGQHALKKIFQEQGVLPWLRERIPLVFAGDVLVAAGGLFALPDAAIHFDPFT